MISGSLSIRRLALAALALAGAIAAPAQASDFSEPWKNPDRALVIDAYEYNPIDWSELAKDKRIIGFIAKGSDGLPPSYYCTGDEIEHRLCKALWKRHAVARELFHTRKTVAKALGLEWGAYHLARPGNPIEQANNFLDFAEPGPDDLMALDIEGIDSTKWMSLNDAEAFVAHIQRRTGRYPVLYTNGATAKHIAHHRSRYPLLSRLQLWYARYTPEIGIHFPKGNWDSFALWQFSASANCNRRACPYRVPGTPNDIDVNVAPMTAAELRAAWPLSELVEAKPDAQLVAEAAPAVDEKLEAIEAAVASRADEVADGAITVPLPISRKAALAGKFELAFASVEDAATPEVTAAGDADVRLASLAPGARAAETVTRSAEAEPAPIAIKVPVPVSRKAALAGKFELAYAAVEATGASASTDAVKALNKLAEGDFETTLKVPLPITRKAALSGKFELVFATVWAQSDPTAPARIYSAAYRNYPARASAFASIRAEPQAYGLFEYLASLKDAELQHRRHMASAVADQSAAVMTASLDADETIGEAGEPPVAEAVEGMSLLRNDEYMVSYRRERPRVDGRIIRPL